MRTAMSAGIAYHQVFQRTLREVRKHQARLQLREARGFSDFELWQALVESDGNITKAAAGLGTKRTYLYERLNEFLKHNPYACNEHCELKTDLHRRLKLPPPLRQDANDEEMLEWRRKAKVRGWWRSVSLDAIG